MVFVFSPALSDLSPGQFAFHLDAGQQPHRGVAFLISKSKGRLRSTVTLAYLYTYTANTQPTLLNDFKLI